MLGERNESAVQNQIAELVDDMAGVISPHARAELREYVERETVGLGGMEEILADPDVDEVLINGPDAVYVERFGRLEEADYEFGCEEELWDTIERILAPVGRRVDELSPMVDARLSDGSRVNVVIPPLALDGPTVSIRRFGRRRPSLEAMVASGSLSEADRDHLITAVADRRTVLVSGGTGSGKTTFLNALSAYIAERERVVTIEDAAELQLQQAHVVRLEARPPSIEGKGAITVRDLLRNALRMRPDRIIIGEVRGAEALDLLTALNTGHSGALSTIHANSPADALERLHTLTLMADSGLPHEVIRRQVDEAVDVIVQLRREERGRRFVEEVMDS